MAVTYIRKPFNIQLLYVAQSQLLVSPFSILRRLGLNSYRKSVLKLSSHSYCSLVSETPIDTFLNQILKNSNTLQTSSPTDCKQSTSKRKQFVSKKSFKCLEVLNTQQKVDLTSVSVLRKDSTIQKLLITEGPEACLEHLRLEDDISKYSFDFVSIKKLIHAASLTGSVLLVKKLLKLAEINFVQTPRMCSELHPHLAVAEFIAGNYVVCLEVLSTLYDVKNFNSKKHKARKLCRMQKHFFQTSYPEVLRDVTTSIIAQIPEVGQSTDLDKADELVRLLNELLHLSWPAFTLWQGYFFSTSQNEWGRADALYAYEGVQKLALRNLRTIVEQLLSLHSVSQVQHFLELLLQYDQRSALPIITSLLLSMQCSEGNLGAAVEVLHFATDLKLRLSYNSMLRLQQLLHHRRVPLPQQLLHLKYLKASHAHKKLLPEYKF